MDNPRCKTVTIYDWPWSQKCMDCKNGEFFQSDTFDTSNMLCHIACTKNNGESCEGFVRQPEENTDEDEVSAIHEAYEKYQDKQPEEGE